MCKVLLQDYTPDPESETNHIIKSMIFSNNYTLSPLRTDIETSSTDEETRLMVINNTSDTTMKRSFTKKNLKRKSFAEKEQKNKK